jgi:hypothetical protein
MGKKWDNPIGDSHKKKVYDLIANNPKGVYQHEIIQHTKLSRQTVYTILKQLRNEKKVQHQNRQYFVEDTILNSVLQFGMVMEEACGLIGDPRRFIGSRIEKIDLKKEGYDHYFNRFSNRISGPSVSSKLCKAKFKQDELFEKYIFEFANRIGAFITYLLIESMRPSQHNTIPGDKRSSLVPRLIDRSIRSHNMYESFSVFFKDFFSGMQKAEEIHDYCNITECFEFREEYYKKAIAAFKNIYPMIYDALENIWTDYIEDSLKISNPKNRKCDHKWQDIMIYKFGRNKYLGCCKCKSVMDSATLKGRS